LDGSAIVLTAAKLRPYQEPELLIEREAALIDAEAGYARVDLQAAELALKPGDYPMTVTMRRIGYSTVLLRGVIRIRENTEFASVGEEYDSAQEPQTLALVEHLGGRVVLQLASELPTVGPRGPAGLDGIDGIDGINGVDGVDGRDGIDGIDGEPGPEGPRGLQGLQGPIGLTGPQGD